MSWTQNLCRTCGQISETCHHIFNTDGYGNLENKIKTCLQLKVNPTDCKPKQICNNCLVKLNDFCEFVNTSQSTNLKFDTIHSSSEKKNKSWSQIEAVSEHCNSEFVVNQESNVIAAENGNSSTTNNNGLKYGTLYYRSIVRDKELCRYNSVHQCCQTQSAIAPICLYQKLEEQKPCAKLSGTRSTPDNRKDYVISVETVRNSVKMSSMNLPGDKDKYVCNVCEKSLKPSKSVNSNCYGRRMKSAKAFKSCMNYKTKKCFSIKGEKASCHLFKPLKGISRRKEKPNVHNGHVHTCSPFIHECAMCNKIFRSKQRLKKHEKSHLNDILHGKKRLCLKNSLMPHINPHL